MNQLTKEKIGKIVLKTIGLKKALKLYYKVKTGRKLNINNPQRYTEKIQLRKCNSVNNQTYILCADKYKVREYIKEKIGEEYLIPIYFAKKKITINDLESLPDSFVLKTNNASQTNIIVKDKTKENLELIVAKMNKFIKYRFGYRSFELFYNNIEPYIIAEKYIGKINGDVPNDYKFFCFTQKDKTTKIIIQADCGRFSDRHIRYFFDEHWNKLEMTNCDNGENNYDIERPQNLEKMLDIAKKLSSDFDYVRVDLYDVDNKIYFGELTFTDGSGYDPIKPDEYDKILGSYWN